MCNPRPHAIIQSVWVQQKVVQGLWAGTHCPVSTFLLCVRGLSQHGTAWVLWSAPNWRSSSHHIFYPLSNLFHCGHAHCYTIFVGASKHVSPPIALLLFDTIYNTLQIQSKLICMFNICNPGLSLTSPPSLQCFIFWVKQSITLMQNCQFWGIWFRESIFPAKLVNFLFLMIPSTFLGGNKLVGFSFSFIHHNNIDTTF